MSRVARVTEYIGRGDGGFYIEDPDIPESLTCQDWRQRRAQARRAERRERPRPSRVARDERRRAGVAKHVRVHGSHCICHTCERDIRSGRAAA